MVCAAFDPATDTAVLAVRDRVAALGVRMPARPRHRPHLTLGAVRAHEEQLAGVIELVRPVAERHPEVGLTLTTVGSFGRAGALWLGPAPADELRTLQRSVVTALAAGPWPTALRGRSRPEEWVPHCTLATRLDRPTLERTQAAIATGFAPLEARVTGLAVILVGGAGDVALLPLTG